MFAAPMRGFHWEALPQRFEKADPRDPLNLVVLLRQAHLGLDRAVRAELEPIVAEVLGPGDVMGIVHLIRRLRRKRSSVAQLADHLRCRHPVVSRRVSRLMAAGLVEKYGSWHDGRSVQIALTYAGEDLVARLDETLGELANMWGEDVDAATWERLSRALDRLADAAP